MKLTDQVQRDDVIAKTKQLLNCLENNEIEDAEQIFGALSAKGNNSIFTEVGKLTRGLHEALANFSFDSNITDIAALRIPNAKDRLNYVIKHTEEAANKTMDNVEECSQLNNSILTEAEELLVDWKKLYKRELSGSDFRLLCKRVENHLIKNKETTESLHSKLSEVLLAQSYQDLTGQVIKQVITLVHDVEESMVNVIKMFGHMDGYDQAKKQALVVDGVEGPIVNADKRDDVIVGQDDVDDLLSSLGF